MIVGVRELNGPRWLVAERALYFMTDASVGFGLMRNAAESWAEVVSLWNRSWKAARLPLSLGH